MRDESRAGNADGGRGTKDGGRGRRYEARGAERGASVHELHIMKQPQGRRRISAPIGIVAFGTNHQRWVQFHFRNRQIPIELLRLRRTTQGIPKEP